METINEIGSLSIVVAICALLARGRVPADVVLSHVR